MGKKMIHEADVGKEYADIIEKVMKIRMARKKLYGDSYNEMPAISHYWHSANKLKRLLKQLDTENRTGKENKNYEKIEDNVLDIINYMIFFLIMRRNEK